MQDQTDSYLDQLLVEVDQVEQDEEDPLEVDQVEDPVVAVLLSPHLLPKPTHDHFKAFIHKQIR